MKPASASPQTITPHNNLSQVRVSTEHPLSTATIAQLLADTALRFADRPAVVFREQGVRWTRAQFASEGDRCAAGLASLGFRPGDRLGIWSPNRVEWLVTPFATARIGVILVNINPAYRLHELANALTTSVCRTLVVAERLRGSDYPGMLRTLAPELDSCKPGQLVAEKLTLLQIVIRMGASPTPGMFGWDELRARGASPDRPTLDTGTAALGCHGAVGAGLRRHGRRDGLPRRSLRRGGHACGGVGGEMHGAARGADDVHRRTRAAGLRPLRPVDAAHRHHGRCAVPDRDDETGRRTDEHA